MAAGGTIFVLAYTAAVFALRIVTAEEKALVRDKFAVMWWHLSRESARLIGEASRSCSEAE